MKVRRFRRPNDGTLKRFIPFSREERNEKEEKRTGVIPGLYGVMGIITSTRKGAHLGQLFKLVENRDHAFSPEHICWGQEESICGAYKFSNEFLYKCFAILEIGNSKFARLSMIPSGLMFIQNLRGETMVLAPRVDKPDRPKWRKLIEEQKESIKSQQLRTEKQ